MEYKDIFRHRGESYDLAMRKYPDARDKEFKNIFYKIPLKKNENILDVPALGGYLKKYCLPDTNVIFLDFSQSINGVNVVCPYEKWNLSPVDRIVCLASVHHVQNLDLFLENLCFHIKKNGFIHIADVSIDSQISKFLDDFVGPNTSTKEHKGKYYDWKKVNFPASLSVIDIEQRECPWVFKSETEMTEYCRLLFDLQDIKDEDILFALNKYVGVTKNKNNIQINWHLTYVDLQT
jgi:hypothetical protein